MGNPAKKVCTDLTERSKCCSHSFCNSLHKNCIRKYLIPKNGPLKPLNSIQKIFDSSRDKIKIKSEINLVEGQPVDDNPEDVQVIVFDEKYDDPGTWPLSMTNLEIDHIIDKGPIRPTLEEYPKDERNRCFSNELYIHKNQDRNWLIYSKEKDAAFCFCCKLFSDNKEDVFCDSGFRDWRYVRSKLIAHSSKKYHVDSILNWYDRKFKVDEAKPKIDENVIIL